MNGLAERFRICAQTQSARVRKSNSRDALSACRVSSPACGRGGRTNGGYGWLFVLLTLWGMRLDEFSIYLFAVEIAICSFLLLNQRTIQGRARRVLFTLKQKKRDTDCSEALICRFAKSRAVRPGRPVIISAECWAPSVPNYLVPQSAFRVCNCGRDEC